MTAERVPITPIREPAVGTGLAPMPGFEHRPLVWSAILGGFLIGLTAWVLLNLLGVALGLTAFNAGRAAVEGAAPAGQAGTNAALWAGISSILAYLIGGFAAARIAHVFPRSRGAGNGVMVFLLSVPFMLLFASQGVSGMLGSLGGIVGGVAGGAADIVAQNPSLPNQAAGQAQATIPTPSPADVTRAADVARNAAWGALAALLLALGASALGGLFGGRELVRETDAVATRH
jgi:hypothetical protein